MTTVHALPVSDPPRDLVRRGRFARAGLALASATLLAGCVSVPDPSPNDPWESYNRGMYAFNDTVDRAVLKPIAVGYDTITPQPVQSCIHNVFNNLADVWRSEEHTSELQSLMRISYAVFCLKKKK